jgi:ubiquinone/menaquinone biosynthesis C-methylase UbiE
MVGATPDDRIREVRSGGSTTGPEGRRLNVFDEFGYPLSYGQFSLDAGRYYEAFANHTLNLVAPKKGDVVLEVACGTGISTVELLKFQPAKIYALDRAAQFLALAEHTVGKTDDVSFNNYFNASYQYPKSFASTYFEVADLHQYLIEQRGKSRLQSDRVRFTNASAHEIRDLELSSIDFAFCSQAFHWFRLYQTNSAAPNIAYEHDVLSQIRNALKPNGAFAFNTTAASFAFTDPTLNQKHFKNHPFHLAFIAAMEKELGLGPIAGDKPALDHQTVTHALIEAGFEVERAEILDLPLPPHAIFDICIVGGQMQFFQRRNLSLRAGERKELIEVGLRKAFSEARSSIDSVPVTEYGMSYVARKKG